MKNNFPKKYLAEKYERAIMPQHCQSLARAMRQRLLFLSAAAQMPGPNQSGDPRQIKNGSILPNAGYSDQPSVVAARQYG